MVVALDDVPPGGKRVAMRCPACRSTRRLCSTASEQRISTSNAATPARSATAPRAACEQPWIDAVRDDRPARTEIVFRHGVRDFVSLMLDAIACPTQRLFDRVDSQVHRAYRSRKLAARSSSYRRPASPERDRQWPAPVLQRHVTVGAVDAGRLGAMAVHARAHRDVALAEQPIARLDLAVAVGAGRRRREVRAVAEAP